jgi:hypothetical protein
METPNSFLKKRFGILVEPCAPMLSNFGLFSLDTATTAALTAAYGFSKMRVSS